MKKLIFAAGCLSLLLSGNSVLLAEEAAPTGGPGPRLGVEAGINLASLKGANVNDVFASRLGLVAGGFLNLPLGPTLALQPEVLYEQKGGKLNGNPYQVDYIEIPILLDVTLVGPLDLLLGPSFDTNVFNNDNTVTVNREDVGLVLGGQLNLGRFLINGRYELGLNDVSPNQSFQNGTFTFLAGLSFI